MDTSEHESIDIGILEKSLEREFKSLPPLSKGCCIYRVPPRMRLLNERLYTPQIVSIGPIHHGREELKAMEEHKTRYLQDFLQRTKVSIKEFLGLIKEREAMLRGCYEETLKIGSEDFVKMILVDAAFIIELFVRQSMSDHLKFGADRIFANPRVLTDIARDLFKLENQIPLFILQDMFNLAKTEMHYSEHYDDVSIIRLTCTFLEPLNNQFLLEENLVEAHFSEAKHLVDLIKICLQSSEVKSAECQTLYIPTATELHQAGVKFEVELSKDLFDISFKDGILLIPELLINNDSEELLRNLQVFEMLHCDTRYVDDYITFINFLVNTPKDAEFLIHKGIILNMLLHSEGASTLIHNLAKEGRSDTSCYSYSGIVEDLNSYCENPWHEWKANLKQNYFNTPWASISVIAAVILLVLTCIQAVCAILAL